MAYWYFRLNGFFQIENFVVHPESYGSQRTDADLLGVGPLTRRQRTKGKNPWLLSGFGVVSIGSRDQAGDEGAEQRLPAAPRVVNELEEAEIERQLLLRDAPVGP